jgi:hypothetical protein
LTSPGPGLSARTRPSRWTWARGELMWAQSVASELRLPGERLRPDWMVAFGAGITIDPVFPGGGFDSFLRGLGCSIRCFSSMRAATRSHVWESEFGGPACYRRARHW